MDLGRILGVSLIALAAASAHAAETPLDEPESETIVVTATRTPVADVDAPATVTVKTAEDIADELATDIKDLVRFEPGVSVRRPPTRFGAALGSTGRGGNEDFTIRGIGGNRVLIQVDGIRVPDGFSFGAQLAGRGDYVDLGLVKTVEILRGPASALYGSDGLAGAVSFTLSDPVDFLDDGRIGGLARAAYSSADEEFSETAILAGRVGDLSAMAAYTRRDFKELDNEGDNDVVGALRTTPNPQDGRSDALLGRIVWAPGGGHRVRLTGEYLDTSLFTDVLSGVGPTGLGPTQVDSLLARDSGERVRASLDWTWEGEGLIDFARVGAYWQDAEDRQFTDEDRSPAADRERLNTFENRVFGGAAEARAAFATGTIGHRLTFGGDVSVTRQKGIRDGVVPPAGETFPTRAFPPTDYTLAGLFVGDEIEIGRLTLFPALRFDYYDLSPEDDPLLPTFAAAKQDGSRLSPKLGAVLRLSDDVRLFGNHARGFKSPRPSEVNQFFENVAFNYTSIPNPDLEPETSESIEGGVRIATGAVRLDMVGFAADYDNFISQEVVGGSNTPRDPTVFQFINLDRVKVRGAEARFEGRTPSGFTGSLTLSYAKGDVIDPDGERSPLSSIDPLKLVAGIGYRDPGNRFGGQIIATHGARKEAGRTEGLCVGTTGAPVPCFRPDAFTILDATAFVRVGAALTLRAGLFNITDEKYAWWADVRGLAASSRVTDAYTQPGRNFSVSLSAKF